MTFGGAGVEECPLKIVFPSNYFAMEVTIRKVKGAVKDVTWGLLQVC